MTLVIAHRGASGHRPENTMSAYALAVEQRADMIEIDLHRTRDGAIVVTHDEELSGLGGRGEIAEATLDEVRALDAGDGQQVPLLSEVLDRFGEELPFNLEIKRGGQGPYAGLEEATLAEVRSRGLLARTLFSSFEDAVLVRLRELSPEARLGVLVSGRSPGDWRERARVVQAQAVHLWLGLATRDTVAAAHDLGLAVHVYTADREDDLRALLDRGVDGIFTNLPDRLRGLLGG